MSRFLLIS